MATAPADPTTPVLLYDGTCGLCARSVQFVLRHERGCHALRFAPLEGAFGRSVRRELPALDGQDSIIWLEGGGSAPVARVRSDAALAVLEYLGGRWRLLARAGRWVPRALRDAVYDLIARHRHRLGGETCVVPTAEERGRFLD